MRDPIIPAWADPARWDQPRDLFTDAENARLAFQAPPDVAIYRSEIAPAEEGVANG